MGTMKDPSPQDLAKCWKELAGDEIDAETLASLVAAIRQWPTGRLATAAGRKSPAIIVSWQKVDGSMYVAMRRGTGSWWLHGRIMPLFRVNLADSAKTCIRPGSLLH